VPLTEERETLEDTSAKYFEIHAVATTTHAGTKKNKTATATATEDGSEVGIIEQISDFAERVVDFAGRVISKMTSVIFADTGERLDDITHPKITIAINPVVSTRNGEGNFQYSLSATQQDNSVLVLAAPGNY